MSDLEERLRAALRARGDLVGSEDLRPARLPSPAPATTWWRRPEVYLAVAAVVVVLLAIPLVALGLTGSDDDAPEPAGTPNPGRTSGDVGEIERMEADVDGDGTPDEVRVLAEMTQSGGDVVHIVSVTFADGVTRSWYAGSDPAELVDAIDLDQQVGGVELLVQVGTSPSTLVVLGAGVGDRLDVHDRRIRSGAGEEGYRFHWWVADGAIRSTLSLRPVPDDATAYAVRVVDWVFVDGGVDRQQAGEFCVAADEPQDLAGCDVITPDPRTR